MRFFDIEFPCTEDDLKSAFRRASKRMHPDVGGDPSQFAVMCDEYKRLTADPRTFTLPLTVLRTTDGRLLADLGLGLGPLVNGKDCAACKKKGYRQIKDDVMTACPQCMNKHYWMRMLCRHCDGQGVLYQTRMAYETCWECRGNGEIQIFNPVLPKGRLIGRL